MLSTAEKKLRNSAVRNSIYEYLCGTKEHPSAEMIYNDLKGDNPNLSLGTVYRNLTLLSDLGEILRLHLSDGVDHFDADTSLHYHFICKDCGSVIDLEMDNINHIQEVAGAGFDGKIAGHVTYFYGSCSSCMRNTQES